MKVAGRHGRQNCVPLAGIAVSRCCRVSTTSQVSSKPRSSSGRPSAWRTPLFAPSQPTRKSPVTVSVRPLSGSRISTSTRSPVSRKPGDRPAEQEGHGLAPLQRLAQQPLHLRLDEGEGRRPAEVPGRRQRIEQLDDLAVDATEIGAGMGPDALGELLRHAAELEDAHALPVERDGARLVVDLAALLGDADGEPARRQQVAQRRADRPAAGDDDVVMGHRRVPAPFSHAHGRALCLRHANCR